MSKEKTAMQEMIDKVGELMNRCDPDGETPNATRYYTLLEVANEMVNTRNTTEKEQIIDAIKLGQKNVTGMDAWKMPYLRCTPQDLYNEKYPNHGK